jgi:hypothetical protein
MPNKQKRTISQQLLNAANKGLITDTLGAPVDLAELVLNSPGMVYSAATGKPSPYKFDKSVGGSEWFSGLLDSTGLTYDDGEDTTGLEEAARLGLGMVGPVALLKGARAIPGAIDRAAPKINKATEDLLRRSAKPVFGTEAAVTNPPFLRGSASALNDPAFVAQGRRAVQEAQAAAGGPYAGQPITTGQGAWMGSEGLELNPLYVQTMPAQKGSVRENKELMRYVADTSRRLNQDANAVGRFVPQLVQDPSAANAMMLRNVSPADIRALAEAGLTDEMVLAARPGNTAFVAGFGNEFSPAKAMSQIRSVVPNAKPTYGKSMEDLDRVFMIKKGDYAPNYSEFLLND